MKEYPKFPSSIEITIGFNLSVIAVENHWIKKSSIKIQIIFMNNNIHLWKIKNLRVLFVGFSSKKKMTNVIKTLLLLSVAFPTKYDAADVFPKFL